jgi:hypothetical protein
MAAEFLGDRLDLPGRDALHAHLGQSRLFGALITLEEFILDQQGSPECEHEVNVIAQVIALQLSGDELHQLCENSEFAIGLSSESETASNVISFPKRGSLDNEIPF